MNIKELADSIVTAFQTYGVPKGTMAGSQPANDNSIMKTSDVVIWAFKNK